MKMVDIIVSIIFKKWLFLEMWYMKESIENHGQAYSKYDNISRILHFARHHLVFRIFLIRFLK